MLDLILQTPGALPALVWGTFGVAKTQKIYQLVQALGWHLEVVIASTRQPEDFGGIGVPHETEGLKRLPDAWVGRVQKAVAAGKKVAVFFDEISCTPPATQAALLRGILEGCFGDVQLDQNMVKYIAGANPPDEAAGGWDLALPLANRFTHVQWEPPTVDEWQNWLVNGSSGSNTYRAHVTPVDPEQWKGGFGKAKAHVGGFLKRFSELFIEDAKKDAGRFPAAFGRPRTWENATRLLGTVYSTGREDVKLALLSGSIGEPAATKFATWLEEANLPDPEDLLKDPKSWTPDKRREDVIFAVLNSVTAAAVQKRPASEYVDRWKCAWFVLERAMSVGRDLVAVAAKTLAIRENRPKGALGIDKGVARILMDLRETLDESGIYQTTSDPA